MKFLEMVEKLQLKNKGYVVMVKNGIFFIGVGKDAIILNKILGLKLICMKTGLCKVGIPVKAIEKYIKLLSFADKSFVVYQYDRKTNSDNMEEIFRYTGKTAEETRCCLDCHNCPNKTESELEIIEKIKNMEKKLENSKKENELNLIPKAEIYIQYMLDIILKLPRTEKFSIGTEYKSSMYLMLRNILYISKVENEKRFDIINIIDSELNCQRIYLRIMNKNHWIDNKKFNVAMEQIYEMGKIVGGLQKYYAKYDKK